MNFYTVATAAAIVSLLIGTIWIFAGNLMFKRWGIKADTLGMMMGKRLGAVYLGVALLLFFVRGSIHADTRTTVSSRLCLALTLLALLSSVELVSQRATRGILVSVIIEGLLAFAFASILYIG